MKLVLWAALGLFLSGCASRRLSRVYPTAPQFTHVRDLHAAEDWPQLSSYAAIVLRDFDFETYADVDERAALWRMAEACEKVGDAQTHAVALRGLTNLADPDAPLALLEFVAAHGREPLERCGALERREVATWLAMEADCQRGDWAAARERIAANFPDVDGAPQTHAAASHILLGDLLRRAERCEPALAEYSTAAYGRALAGDPLGYISVRERTLGCVRMESLLFEMGEGEWALEAMKIVNLKRDMLAAYPRSQVLDQAVRDGANAEAEVLNDINWHYDNPKAPELPELAQDLAALAVFGAPQLEGRATTWSAPSLGLKLVASDEVLRVESSLSSVGAYEVAWTTETWESGPKCFVYTEPQDSRGRCVRRFRDGSIFFGSAGFDSNGLLLRRDREPYTGPGLFGRPLEEAVQVVSFRKNEPANGPSIEGLGERREFVANVACGAFLIGEGYVQGDNLVPDGVVRLAYSSSDWFRTRFVLGVAAPWRRSGNVVLSSNLSLIEDLSGQQVAWVDPRTWGERIEQAEKLQATAQREQFERGLQAQMDIWASMGKGEGHGVQLGSGGGGYPCYTCNGVGSIYGSGRWESFTYYEQSDPGSLPTPRSGTRWVNGARDNCPKCFGTGRQ